MSTAEQLNRLESRLSHLEKLMELHLILNMGVLQAPKGWSKPLNARARKLQEELFRDIVRDFRT